MKNALIAMELPLNRLKRPSNEVKHPLNQLKKTVLINPFSLYYNMLSLTLIAFAIHVCALSTVRSSLSDDMCVSINVSDLGSIYDSRMKFFGESFSFIDGVCRPCET